MNIKDLSSEKVNEIDTMLRKLAYMKISNGHLRMEFEDVVSELWINVLKIIEKRGNIDMNYLASASFNKMVDLARYNIRREATPIPDDMFGYICSETDERTNNRNKNTRTSDSYMTSTCFENMIETVEIMAILDLFEEDSKEYKLVKSWMKIFGIIEEGDVKELPEKAFDRYIAVDILGYAGSKSNGYARIRQKVRNTLIEAGYYNL